MPFPCVCLSGPNRIVIFAEEPDEHVFAGAWVVRVIRLKWFVSFLAWHAEDSKGKDSVVD